MQIQAAAVAVTENAGTHWLSAFVQRVGYTRTTAVGIVGREVRAYDLLVG